MIKRDWVHTAEFAELAGISRQRASAILRRCEAGNAWRGYRLEVVADRGRGGRGGLVYYVRASSLPAELAQPSAPPVEAGRTVDPAPMPRHTGSVAEWKLSVIQPIRQQTAEGSEARSRMIRETAAGTRYAHGKKRGKPVSERAIRRWIADYENGGLNALARRRRADRGGRKTVISRAWDQAARDAGLSDAEMEEIKSHLDRKIKSLWQAGNSSWETVQFNLLPVLVRQSQEAGIDLSDSELRRICLVPKHRIDAFKRHRAVHIARRDAGRSAAVQIPRIRRDRSNLAPMEWVAADIHHDDIAFCRDDGSICTVKSIAWMDLATNRAFITSILVPKGQMIRREHVLQSYMEMCADPNWGIPTRIYADHGGEYNWAELIEDISKLKHTSQLREVSDLALDLEDKAAYGMSRSLPYNPQSKVIESLFGTLERRVFSQIPGHMGGDRLKKKSESQGKEPKPYPGDFKSYCATIQKAIEYYHAFPQRNGFLAGQSPADRFRAFVDAGWTSTTLDPRELAIAFSREVTRNVYTGGKIEVDGGVYRADAIAAYAGVAKVLVRVPIIGGREPECVFVFDDEERFLCVARPGKRFPFDDPRGAGEQQRQTSEWRRQIRALEAEGDPVDSEQTMAEATALHGAPVQAQSAARVSLSPEYRRAASEAERLPAGTADQDDRDQREQSELLERQAQRLRARGKRAASG